MGRIFLFIYQHRDFFTFLLLEVLCVWLIIRNNEYQGAQFFNSSNRMVGSINTFSQNTRDYFALRDVNVSLSEENIRLRQALERYHQQEAQANTVQDSSLINRFDFISARVVNNSTDRYTNFITINKGKSQGIEPGMAVISSDGVVGKVRMTSQHFSVITSLLNINLRVSGLLKRTGHFGTVQWDGADAGVVGLNFIPRHVKPAVGDTIVTSGYSGVFPEGMMIGTIEEIQLPDETPFYELKVRLAQDFRKLSFVTVIRSNLLHELDSLEQQIPDMKR
ncbi:MAG: rod shape-determining protein MreC [Cyclobacteriaceae bacterium]|jgi:rod shape-determining protein MreC|nr:rod shape-determining protein MreC [Cyclobacteriaceae bacterium]